MSDIEIKYETKECPLYIGNTCHALDKAYRVGRADAIDEAIKWAKKNHNISGHYKHNFSSERVIETTVNYDELIAKLEQIKEQKNE